MTDKSNLSHPWNRQSIEGARCSGQHSCFIVVRRRGQLQRYPRQRGTDIIRVRGQLPDRNQHAVIGWMELTSRPRVASMRTRCTSSGSDGRLLRGRRNDTRHEHQAADDQSTTKSPCPPYKTQERLAVIRGNSARCWSVAGIAWGALCGSAPDV